MKKVLISLDELYNVYNFDESGRSYMGAQPLEEWFDTQPDVSEIIMEQINYKALKGAVNAMQEAVSKMEITE